MTLNREYQPSSNRVCAYSYVKETELPEGQRLLTCSKCEETCYVDVESQMAHWPLHKKTCCSLAKDNKRIREGLGFDDFEECLRYIEIILKAPLQLISGRNLLYAFQQLRSYLLETDVFTGSEDQLKIDSLMYEHVNQHLVGLGKNTQADEFRASMWASPGFANYFLSDEVYLSPQLKEMKVNRIPPPPSETFLDFGTVDFQSSHDALLQFPMPYARFLSAFSLYGMFSETEPLLENPLSLAGARHVMRNWTDDYSRLSYPAYQGPSLCPWYRGKYFWGVYSNLTEELKSRRQPCIPMSEDELVPGLTLKQFLRVLLVDDSSLFDNDKWTQQAVYPDLIYLASCQISDPDHSVWTCLTIGDRVDLLELFFKCWCGRELWMKKLDPDRGEDSLCMLQLCGKLILGNQTKTFMGMYHVAMNTFMLSSDDSNDDEQTKALRVLSFYRDELVRDILPSVKAYFRSVVQHLKEQNLHLDKASFCASSFPQELLELIAEYSVRDTFDWCS